jgi:hypothetical protein
MLSRLPCVVRPGGEDKFVFIDVNMNRFDGSIYIPTSSSSKYRSEISCALFSVLKETTAFAFHPETKVCWLHISQSLMPAKRKRQVLPKVLPKGSKVMVRKVGILLPTLIIVCLTV